MPENAGILIQSGVIMYIGEEAQAVDEVLDASGCIVCPGLINTHRQRNSLRHKNS